ncbi:MAG: class II glutamine amidotransferase [Phycisphaerales bacterium]|nr:class II glutamine amidotransferase [Phycisphaerales bacterium]
MCRWLAYHGPPTTLAHVLLDPEHSLIDQSRAAVHSRFQVNGDGVGVGWFDGIDPDPGLYREARAAWHDDNLQSLARHIRSECFLAHVRAATTGAVERANAHPFRAGGWLFQHNGELGDWPRLRRAVESHIDPRWYAHREGSTDSEALFLLALSLGLRDDPVGALIATVDLVRAVRASIGQTSGQTSGETSGQTSGQMSGQISGQALGQEAPLRVTAAATDGRALYCIRTAEDALAPSLYWGHGGTLRSRQGTLCDVAPEAVLVVSEPLDTNGDAWQEVPPEHILKVEAGSVQMLPIDMAYGGAGRKTA